MTNFASLKSRQDTIHRIIEGLGRNATVEQVRASLPASCALDDAHLNAVVPSLQAQLFASAATPLPPAELARSMDAAPPDTTPQSLPQALSPQMLRDDGQLFSSLIDKMARFSENCRARRCSEGIEIELGGDIAVADCEPLLRELGICPARTAAETLVLRAADAAKLDEHLGSEAALIERIAKHFSEDFKDAADPQWDVAISALAPGVYRITHRAQPATVRLKASYSLHTTLRQVDKLLHLHTHPDDHSFVPPRCWAPDVAEQRVVGRFALNLLDQVLTTSSRQKGMLDVAFQNARLARPDAFANATIEVMPLGSKPLCDFLQKAQTVDAWDHTDTFTPQCEALGCSPKDVLQLQACGGYVVLPGTVQLRTDSVALKEELEALFRAFDLKGANGRPKEFLDTTTAATIEPNRYICNLGWFEPPIIDLYFSLEAQPAKPNVAQTRHGLRPAFLGTADHGVMGVRQNLEDRVRATCKSLRGKARAILGDIFVDRELRTVHDVKQIPTAIANDTYVTAAKFYALSDRGLRLGHDTLSDATRRTLCYGSAPYGNSEPDETSETQRQSRLDMMEAKLLASPTLQRHMVHYAKLRSSLTALFESARANNHKVGAHGGAASYYSLELLTEGLQNIEIVTARVLQADAESSQVTGDAIDRFCQQLSEIGDLWPGCAEGLTQKTRPLVAAINAASAGATTLETQLATLTSGYLDLYIAHCRKMQDGANVDESSMRNMEGAFDHIIGRGTARAAGSGWGTQHASINEAMCRTLLKVNIPVDSLIRNMVEQQYLPELRNIRGAWEAGKEIHTDWETLLDNLSCTPEEKLAWRVFDEYMMESVPRFNDVEWMLPVLALRHLVRSDVVARAPEDLQSMYNTFLRYYEGATREKNYERQTYGRTSYQEAAHVTPSVER